MEDLENRPGVIKVIHSKPYYTVEDVMGLLGVSRSKAYKIIKALRDQLVADGKINALYPAGKVPRVHFDRQFCTGRRE